MVFFLVVFMFFMSFIDLSKLLKAILLPGLDLTLFVLALISLINFIASLKSFLECNHFGNTVSFGSSSFFVSPSSFDLLSVLSNFEFSFIEVWFTDQNSELLENLIDTATKTGIDAAKTASKRVVQKTAEATGGLIGNKIADKIASLDKRKSKEKEKEEQEINIPPQKIQQIIDDLRLF